MPEKRLDIVLTDEDRFLSKYAITTSKQRETFRVQLLLEILLQLFKSFDFGFSIIKILTSHKFTYSLIYDNIKD